MSDLQHRLSRRWPTLVVGLALLTSLLSVPGASAQESGNVDVSATVNGLSPLTITLCDPTADFGTSLDANGTQSNSTDTVSAIRGNATAGEGTWYLWSPRCTTGSFIEVTSGNAWDGGVCGTQGTGTSSLSLANGDLRFDYQYLASSGNYSYIGTYSKLFPTCDQPVDWLETIYGSGYTAPPGTQSFTFYYYLNVERVDTPGTFAATTTWSVIG